MALDAYGSRALFPLQAERRSKCRASSKHNFPLGPNQSAIDEASPRKFVDIEQWSTDPSEAEKASCIRPLLVNSALESPSVAKGDCRSECTSTRQSVTRLFEVEMAKKSGGQILSSLRTTVNSLTSDEYTAGTSLWAAVNKAYFGSLQYAGIQLNEDADECAEALSQGLLADLGRISLETMEREYKAQLATARDTVMERFWELYERMPLQRKESTAGLMQYAQDAEFQQTARSFLTYFETNIQHPRLDGEDCSVCGSPESTEGNLIVFCSNCEVGVHQSCYRIAIVPSGPWYCARCQNNAEHSQCVFCLRSEGAMVRTDDGGWGHLSCAWLVDAPLTADGRIEMSAVRYTLGRCAVCHLVDGVCTPCPQENCDAHFHPECWRLMQHARNSEDDVKFTCSKHSKSVLRAKLRARKKQAARELRAFAVNLQSDKVPRHKTARTCSSLSRPQKRRCLLVRLPGLFI